MDQQKIGKFLKTLRNEKELTQEQLAQVFNVSSRTISRWETGSNLPDISLLVEIADYYDIDVREIIEGERKSEMMDKETRDVATKMADYAGSEKGKLYKLVRGISLVGTLLLTIAIVLQCTDYQPSPSHFFAVILSFLGFVAMAITALYANGMLSKLIKKKAFTTIVEIAVVILAAITLKFIIVAVLIIGVSAVHSAETESGADYYDKSHLVNDWHGEFNTSFYTFPDDIDNAISSDYEALYDTNLFDTVGYIILSTTYNKEDYFNVIQRLSQISCTVFDSYEDNSDYHITDIKYDDKSYYYPAYIANDGFDSAYEYALLDEDNNRIIYIALSIPNVDSTLSSYKDYLKIDTSVYDSGNDNNNAFSIYTFSFSKDVISTHEPEDEGRITTGKER